MHFHIVSLSCFYFKTILFNIIIHLDFLLNINFLLPIKQKVMLALRERISQSFLMIQMGPLWTNTYMLLSSLLSIRWVLCEPIAVLSCHRSQLHCNDIHLYTLRYDMIFKFASYGIWGLEILVLAMQWVSHFSFSFVTSPFH